MSYISTSGERKTRFPLNSPEKCLPNDQAEDLMEDEEFMLDTDMCLVYPEADAELQPMCCNWILNWHMPQGYYTYDNNRTHCGQPVPFCGGGRCPNDQRARCCKGVNRPQELHDKFSLQPDFLDGVQRPQFLDCSDLAGKNSIGGKRDGPGVGPAREFANDEKYWLHFFLVAWQKATNNGFDNLKCLHDGDCSANIPSDQPKGFVRNSAKVKGHRLMGGSWSSGKQQDGFRQLFPFSDWEVEGSRCLLTGVDYMAPIENGEVPTCAKDNQQYGNVRCSGRGRLVKLICSQKMENWAKRYTRAEQVQRGIVKSAVECQKKCQDHSECEFWDWYGYEGSPFRRFSCWLKSKTACEPAYTSAVGALSGPKNCSTPESG
jgi:hypothetical protein